MTSRLALVLAAANLVSACALAAEVPNEKHFTNSLGMKLVRIEPGSFVMGQGDAPPETQEQWLERDADESPAHRVRISTAFYLGAQEVTNAQYERFDPAHKKLRGRDRVGRADDEPASLITWQQAADFCRWLSEAEGRLYRLPTEAEWEYACRAGTTGTFSTGERITAGQANIGLDRSGKQQLVSTPVGSYPPNPWGLYDMHGNVEEWCLDWYGPYESGEQVDPVGRADGYARVTRGGSFNVHPKKPWLGNSRYCRSANRAGYLPEDANRCVGFRAVLGGMPATKPLGPAAPPLNQQDVKQSAAPAEGKDPKRPYFVDFVRERRNPTIPPNTWGPIFSQHNHYSAVCACPNGDLLAAWYTTVSEEGRELALAASRLPAGSDRWQSASLFFDVPDMNDHAPVLFCDGRRVYHFSLQALRGWDNASIILRTSDDSGATWSKPRIILTRDDADPLSQPCSALRQSDGTLVLACDGDNHRNEKLMTSSDGGRTWTVRRGNLRQSAGGRYVIHPAIARRGDGSILCFLRGQDPMPAFITGDLGDTWTPHEAPFPGISVGQKAAALRLSSGAILLCSMDNRKQIVGGGTFAALSLDEGRTWPHVRKIESVGGYMSVAQTPAGMIHLFGSRMGCVAFNEAWLREGDKK